MRILSTRVCIQGSRAIKNVIPSRLSVSISTSGGAILNSKAGFDFESVFRSHRVPKHFNFASDVFDWHAATNPSNLALWVENESHSKQWTYSQLRAESVRASISLRRLLSPNLDPRNKKCLSVSPLTSIFVVLPRVPEWWFLYLASIRIGTIFCPATVQLTPEDIAFRLRVSGARMVITDDENMWKIEAAQRLEKFPAPIKVVVPRRRNLEESSDSWIRYEDLVDNVTDSEVLAFRNADTESEAFSQVFFTSGTTGKPKMVAHSHSTYGIGHYKTTEMMTIKEGDLYWNISDPGWAKSSYGNIFCPWIAGAGVYIHQMERFEVPRVLEILRTRPIDGFCAPPTLFRAMVQENDKKLFKFKSLKYCITGGEALGHEIARVWLDKTEGVSIESLYGQTEMTSSLGYAKEDLHKPDSMGKATYGYDLRITDDEGNELPRGTQGNLAVKVKPNRPIGLFKGYLEEGPNGLQIIEDHKSSAGDYYLTGDLSYQDEDGDFFYVGRADDVIISAGYRIGPFEVESVLQRYPAVAENAVVPSPHELRGAVVKAFIVLAKEYKDHDKDELVASIQNFCKEHTAPYKYPRKIEFVDSLPKTVSGKIMRRELKSREEAKHLGG